MTQYRIVEHRGVIYVERKGWWWWHRLDDADHGWRRYRTIEEARADIAHLRHRAWQDAQPVRIIE